MSSTWNPGFREPVVFTWWFDCKARLEWAQLKGWLSAKLHTAHLVQGPSIPAGWGQIGLEPVLRNEETHL